MIANKLNIVKRGVKGSPLTYAEMDTNLNELYNVITDVVDNRDAQAIINTGFQDANDAQNTALSQKVDSTNIVDDLTSTDATKVLSAKQGKTLSDAVALKIAIASIVDDLTSTDATKVLSAKQGKVLSDTITAAIATAMPPGMTAHFATMTAPTGFMAQTGAAVSRTTYAALFAVMTASFVGTITSGSPTITGVATTNAIWVGMPISGPGIPAGATILSLVANTSVTLSANATATTAGATAVVCPFGVGDGSTTFNLPDGRGRVTRGWDNGAGVDVGRVLGSLQADQNAAHTHAVTDPGHSHSIALGMSSSTASGGVYGPTSGSGVGTGGAVTNISIQSSGGTEARMKNIAMLACIKY